VANPKKERVHYQASGLLMHSIFLIILITFHIDKMGTL